VLSPEGVPGWVVSEGRWEVGSEFDWPDVEWGGSSASRVWPAGELFSSGRAALLALAQLRGGDRPRLHLPTFFCAEVVVALSGAYEVVRFSDLPSEDAPDFATLGARPGDHVLAVNYFGVRERTPWDEWRREHTDVVVIENHTHAPLSAWARSSRSDYAVASVRKTMPVPDGALIWSGSGRPLPSPAAPPPRGAYEKLEAMLVKRAWLHGADGPKERFRELQVAGEGGLEHPSLCRATAATSQLLASLDAAALFDRRQRNVADLLQRTSGLPERGWRPLFTSWAEGATPFNFVLVCRTESLRDRLLEFLVTHAVFPAVHWRAPDDEPRADARARDLAGRVLTISADHRYGPADLRRVTEILAAFR